MIDDIADSRILVADDDSIFRTIIGKLLKLDGYNNATFVEDGEKAFLELVNTHYDLCITDTFMPKKKGYEVIQQYRASPAANGTKFIAMSGNLDDKLMQLYGVLGAAVVSKPFIANDFLEIIEANLKKKI
jgi:CheY-like chemotaxis protein